jgi:hypothetical protein
MGKELPSYFTASTPESALELRERRCTTPTQAQTMHAHIVAFAVSDSARMILR